MATTFVPRNTKENGYGEGERNYTYLIYEMSVLVMHVANSYRRKSIPKKSNSMFDVRDIITIHSGYLTTQMNTKKVTPKLIYKISVLYVADT